jgi:hypothetical protein
LCDPLNPSRPIPNRLASPTYYPRHNPHGPDYVWHGDKAG